jgi:hypothetical protein
MGQRHYRLHDNDADSHHACPAHIRGFPLNQEITPAIEEKIHSPADPARGKDDTSTLLLALAGVVGLFQMATHVVPFGKGFEMVAIAQNLAEHGTYANPFGVLATGPTAANPPLYPFLLAVAFRLLHSLDLVALAATAANIIANAITATLLPRVSILFYGDKRPGIVAAILWIFACPLLPAWDVEFTVLTILIFCLFTSATMAKSRSSLTAVTAGLLASALFLLNPSTLFIFGPWALWLAFERRKALGQAFAYCSITFAVLLMVGSAWGFRNKQQLGAFAIRTNLGMALYVSNNDCASPSLKESEQNFCHEAHHPNTSIEEARLLISLGEIRYDRLREADAKTWMRTHPSAFRHLTLGRIRDFWFPVPWDSRFESAVIWLATALSIPGLVIMGRRHDRVLVFVLLALLIYPLMYYIIISDVRYRLPVLWLSLLPAGSFVIWVWDRARKQPQLRGDA